jgi:hypothetical protein
MEPKDRQKKQLPAISVYTNPANVTGTGPPPACSSDPPNQQTLQPQKAAAACGTCICLFSKKIIISFSSIKGVDEQEFSSFHRYGLQ